MCASPVEAIATRRALDALERVGSRVRGSNGKWRADCPHGDHGRDLKLGVLQTNRGVLVHCFAGCDERDVLAALGLSGSERFDDHHPDRERQAVGIDPGPGYVKGRPDSAVVRARLRRDDPNAYKVYTAIEWYAWTGPTGAWPEEATIASRTGFARGTVARIKRRLRDRGVLDWHKAKSRGGLHFHCHYTLLLDWSRPAHALKALVRKLTHAATYMSRYDRHLTHSTPTEKQHNVTLDRRKETGSVFETAIAWIPLPRPPPSRA